jgi:hypothetical protein
MIRKKLPDTNKSVAHTNSFDLKVREGVDELTSHDKFEILTELVTNFCVQHFAHSPSENFRDFSVEFSQAFAHVIAEKFFLVAE